MSGRDSRIVAARVATGMLIVLAIMVAFLYRLVAGGSLPPWLVLVVAVLGLGAGAALLGRKPMQTAAAIFRREGDP